MSASKPFDSILALVYNKDRPISSTLKTLGALSVVHYSIKIYRAIQWRREMAKLFPGPPYNPWMGNLPDLDEYGGFGLKFFKAMHEKYGPVFGFFLGPFDYHLSIDHPEHMQIVHKAAQERPDGTYKIVNYLGKENILFQHGAWQRKMRRSYQEIVNDPNTHSSLNKEAWEAVQGEIKPWGKETSGVNAYDRFAPLIYDVMGKVLFGAEWTKSAKGKEIMENHLYCVHNTMRWAFLPWSPIWDADYRKYTASKQGFWDGVANMLDKRRKELAANPKLASTNKDVYTLLLTAKNDDDGSLFYDRNTAVSTMLVFLNGAFDTTLNSTIWLLYFLAKHPQTQQKLRDEIDKAYPKLGSGSEAPDMKGLMMLPYLDAVIREGMRYIAAAPINMRLNMESDYNVEGLGTIPKDVTVVLCYELSLTKKDVFGDDADEFNPERFMGEGEDVQQRKRSWTPFGDHSRMCVGRNFALVELRLFIATIISKYTFTLKDPDQKIGTLYEAGINVPDPKPIFIFKDR